MVKNKKAMALETLGGIIIVLVVVVIAILAIIALKGKGISALDYIKNLFRFG